MSQFGIPYMGSKSDIVASIAMNFPSADNFYDLFGGGFSVSHYMLKHKSHKYKSFHYNELIPSTVELVKQAINGDFSYDKFKPEWISREDFFKRKETDAYVLCLWSFGNNQKTYIFGTDIEPYKKSMHMAVVFDEFDGTAQNVLGFKVWPKEVSSIKARRMYIRQKINFDNKRKSRGDLERLERLEQLEQLQRLEQLEQLEQLERLQKLQQLQQLERLTMTALDYRDVVIKPNSIVYCDIPYKNTSSYVKVFSHDEFFNWAASRDFPVYISEYEIKDPRFKLVYAVAKTVKLSGTGMSKENENMDREKLYWNGKTL